MGTRNRVRGVIQGSADYDPLVCCLFFVNNVLLESSHDPIIYILSRAAFMV